MRMRGFDINGDSHHREAEWLEFEMQCLPPGQAGATASITRPGDEQHLSTAQAAEPEGLAVAIDQLGIGGDGCGQCSTRQCRRPDCRHAVLLIGDDRHPEALGENRHVDRAVIVQRPRRRHADLAAARALGPDVPASCLGESLRRDGSGRCEDHSLTVVRCGAGRSTRCARRIVRRMEIEKFAGLPAHPLFAHLPVVMVPLAGLIAIAFAVRPVWLDRFGWGLVAVSGIGMLGAVLAAGSGEALEEMLERGGVGESGVLEQHADMGEAARTISIAFFVVVLAVVAARRRARRQGGPSTGLDRAVGSRVGAVVMSAALAISAAAATASVAAAGHKGAEAHWNRVNKGLQVDDGGADYRDSDDDDGD